MPIDTPNISEAPLESGIKKIVIQPGDGITALVDAFRIDQKFLEKLQNLGTLRAEDVFTFVKNPNGSGVLTKIRTKVEPGEGPINKPYDIPKDAMIPVREKVLPKSVVKNILTTEEKEQVAHIYDDVHVGVGFIEYRGNKISINTKPGMELDVQSLVAQMIIRAKYDIQKDGIIQKVHRAIGNPYYEKDGYDIEANNRMIDTTMVTKETLAKLFSYKTPTTGHDIHHEQEFVAEIIVNFVNGIVAKEITPTV